MAERRAPIHPHLASLAKRLPLLAGLAVVGAVALRDAGDPAKAQIAVQNQGYVPFSDAPINYRTRPLTDPVALLQKRLDAGQAHLTWDDKRGYLTSVLKLLDVPADSQTLVFSKTSFQFTKISPDHPRALYYNDDVYVGSVHDGKTVEIVSFDPMQGAIFYLLDDQKAEKPTFQRAELDCTQCHIAAGTRGVPGVLLRSVYPAQSGALTPRSPQYITDQKSPLKDRWGGWYVNGPLAGATMANAAAVPAAAGVQPETTAGGKILPMLGAIAKPFDPAAYVAPGSDAVALLVLAHQTQAHNLITLTNYQTRLALHALGKDEGTPAYAQATLASLPEEARDKITKPAEQLLRYLLFSGEAPLGGGDARKVIAASPFARSFAAQGLRDSQKRSLRDFDLSTRTFRYPCSYLIYSGAFDAIPEPAKGYVYHRLLEVLSGQDQSADFAHLSPGTRQAILQILLETKPGLPAEWHAYAAAHHLRSATFPRQRTTAS
ncbi:hypothetical protein [Novosphingobium terrae]|uniref:hypothetical protein n=1 Tax=Novosphingobium terrae TaxID=2726189 RepID=UPI0019801C51|nr:hypothetical protein [Novosphingobium terrae]